MGGRMKENQFSLSEIEALATDYDRTLTTTDLRLERGTIDAMNALHRAGIKLIIVSGRQLEFLLRLMASFEHIDALVAENGGVVMVNGRTFELSAAEGERIASELRSMGVPISKGRVISYVDAGHIRDAVEASRNIRGAKVVMNIDSAMVMPEEVDKDKGLGLALSLLGLDEHRIAVAGDGENDISLFRMKSLKVALENSVGVLKERADIIVNAPGGAGITQLAADILKSRNQ